MSRTVLDKRLRTAADLVRQGAYFADIGTDHAYLPVFLLEEGRISEAYASDVAEGPVASAKTHIAASSVKDRVTLRLADGLDGLFTVFPKVTDIAICGMGGELISHLIEKAPLVRNSAIQLILQPMTRAEVLRRYLAENGFAVKEERLSRESGRIYTCMSVYYTGKRYTLSPLSALLGETLLSGERTALFYDYVKEKLSSLETRIKGLTLGGCDATEDEAFRDTLLSILKEKENTL